METKNTAVSYEACNKQGKTFAIANRFGRDMKEYAERFIRSELVADSKDFDYSYYQLAAPSYSLDFVDDEELHEDDAKTGGISNDEAYWIGFFYKYLALALSTVGDALLETVPFEWMRRFYAKFGSLPKDVARDRLLDILRSENEKNTDGIRQA